MLGKLGGQGELGHATQGGESPDHKGEKRDSRQAGLEHPQTPGGGKRTKRSDGPSIIKLQEFLPKGNSPKQVGKASEVKELNEANQVEGGVELGRREGKEDTSGSWRLEPWPSQMTAEGSDKEQASAKREVANPRLSTTKLRLWDRPNKREIEPPGRENLAGNKETGQDSPTGAD